MAGNTFGQIFKLTTFGESHGAGIGGIIDGCPAGLVLDTNKISTELRRRRPGQSAVTTDRNEEDSFEILSGIFEGKTTGTPISFLIRNQDAKSSEYNNLKDIYRPSHADYSYEQKYGFRDYRGGGRSSARETAARVFGGAIAKQLLDTFGIKINAFVSRIGPVKINSDFNTIDLTLTEESIVRCPDKETSEIMISYISELKKEGDSAGGIIHCKARNVPPGLGEPVFDKLHADLGKAMLSINAVHGFEYGSGFDGTVMKGSQHNDNFKRNSKGETFTSSNYSGGIQGGISNGMEIYFNVAFKPVSTILKPQQTINQAGEAVEINVNGRHDPCVVPRAVPIVEAMTALVLTDHLLRNKNSKI